MPDNSTQDSIIELLIRYLDGELTTDEAAAVESLLKNDVTARERYDNILAARDAIRLKGIREKVQSLHKQYYPLVSDEQTNETAKIIRPSISGRIKMIASIAAIFIVIIAGYVLYEYSTTSNESVYADNFMSYQLPVLRGEPSSGYPDSLFNTGNFPGLIKAEETKQQLSQKEEFLLGLSYLQTGETNKAIVHLQTLQKMNSASTEKYFTDESDYYLALAYIKAGNILEAQDMLNKIASNPKHLYYARAKEVSKTALIILKWKN